MATSKAKKPTAKNTTATTKGTEVVEKNTTKVEAKPATKAAQVKKAETQAVKLDSKKEVVKKEPAKPTTKPAAKETKAVAKTATKPAEKTQSKAAKVQKSGRGIAFLALLCSLGALAISGFNLYERKFAPNAIKPAALISGVNDIGVNVSAMGDLVETLQTEIKEVANKQTVFVKADELSSLVSSQVEKQVSAIAVQSNVLQAAKAGDLMEGDSDVNHLSVQAEVVQGADLVPVDGAESNVVDSKVAVSSAIEGAVDLLNAGVTSEAEVIEEVKEPVELWSWERAKEDFWGMFNFISVRKLDKAED